MLNLNNPVELWPVSSDGRAEGEGRWMSVRLRCPVYYGQWTDLNGRIALHPAPYALTAMNLPVGTVLDAKGAATTTLTVKKRRQHWGRFGLSGHRRHRPGRRPSLERFRIWRLG